MAGRIIYIPPYDCMTLTGLVLGDLRLGVMAAGLTELAFAGLTPAGGTKPPNPIYSRSYDSCNCAYNEHDPAATAIGLALPFSFLMQYIILFFYSIFSVFMGKGGQVCC